MRLSSWIQQYSLCVYWPVPSLVAAGVLLHIWNLPNEMTRKQSCCSERCCSRSGIHSPVAAVLVQIWHTSCQVSLLRFHQQVFFSQFSSIWPFLKFDYPILRVISRPPERLSSGYSFSLCVSYPSQACFWTDRYDLLHQYLVEYSSITACLFTALYYTTLVFAPREGSHDMN